MSKTWLLIISLSLLLLLTSCQKNDPIGPPDETCDNGLTIINNTCCLDDNTNNICDNAETRDTIEENKIYWIQSTRSCLTIPDEGSGGKQNFCETSCFLSYQLEYSDYECIDTNAPKDYLKCACKVNPKNPTGYHEWLTTYHCDENRYQDINQVCEDHCDTQSMDKSTAVCDSEEDNRIRCGCEFRPSLIVNEI